jgi:hypothetical protein
MIDALTVAMAMVPGLYSRNRMFSRFTDPVVRRARARARMVRGLVRFVSREDAEVEVTVTEGQRMRVYYRIARLHLERTVQITELELALLRVLLGGSAGAVLAQQTGDLAVVENALAILPKEEVSSVA